MLWILLIILAVTFPATVAAQDCPDGTAEGTSPVDAPCKLCLNGVLEPLPPRTTCGDEVRFGCDANGAFRDECVYVDPPNGEETVCETAVSKGPACPNGLTCDTGESLCRAFCDGPADCRDGFDCEEQRCVAIEPPDMGMPPADMGGDMGVERDMGTDAGSSDMGAEPDMELPSDAGTDGSDGNDESDSGGCCAVMSGGPPAEPGLMLLLAVVLFWRRRA